MFRKLAADVLLLMGSVRLFKMDSNLRSAVIRYCESWNKHNQSTHCQTAGLSIVVRTALRWRMQMHERFLDETNDQCASLDSLNRMAERELGAFFAAVTELFGP